MKTSTLRNFAVIAAGTPLVVLGHAEIIPPPEPVGTITRTAEPRVVNIQAKNLQVDSAGMASFTLDLSGLNLAQLLELVNSDRTAIFFHDSPKDPSKLCPFFNLATRPYEVRQIDPDKPILRISAKVSPDEVQLVEKAGCLITPTISRSDIKPYQP